MVKLGFTQHVTLVYMDDEQLQADLPLFNAVLDLEAFHLFPMALARTENYYLAPPDDYDRRSHPQPLVIVDEFDYAVLDVGLHFHPCNKVLGLTASKKSWHDPREWYYISRRLNFNFITARPSSFLHGQLGYSTPGLADMNPQLEFLDNFDSFLRLVGFNKYALVVFVDNRRLQSFR